MKLAPGWRVVEPEPKLAPGWRVQEESVSNPMQQDNQFNQEEPQETSGLDKFFSGVTGFNSKAGNIFHGILQPLLESGYLGENISNASKNVANQRNREYEEEYNKNPMSTFAGGALGSTLPILPAGGGAGALLRGIAPKLGPGALRMLSGMLGGAGTGASEYVNPGESRGGNALTSGAIGAGLGMVPGTANVAKNLVVSSKQALKGLSPEKMAKKVINDRKKIEGVYGDKYKGFFKEAKEAGINKVEMPKFKTKSLLKTAEANETKALRKFIKNPTLENAHWAKSDLGKIERSLKKSKNSRGLNSDEKAAYESAITGKKKLTKAMNNALNEKGKSALPGKYKEITSGYKKEVIPYTRSSVINKYLDNELTDKDFIKVLSTNKIAKKQLLPNYPELEKTEFAKNLLTKLGIGGGLLSGGYELIKLINGGKNE